MNIYTPHIWWWYVSISQCSWDEELLWAVALCRANWVAIPLVGKLFERPINSWASLSGLRNPPFSKLWKIEKKCDNAPMYTSLWRRSTLTLWTDFPVSMLPLSRPLCSMVTFCSWRKSTPSHPTSKQIKDRWCKVIFGTMQIYDKSTLPIHTWWMDN